ncbi:diguanylate cyclase [uncultured Halopseudomonas sp.]|uniref:diguanylate cyclase n=1 Tax=uncultured Halopseudomonas sp. TaxID=2901193 RepID=UPI0030EC57FF|tara:strand:+ start:8103 stop:9944 length:1842 start_codon:yes stop_codon:yes gene_type:complete
MRDKVKRISNSMARCQYLVICCLLVLCWSSWTVAQPESRILKLEGDEKTLDLQPWLELKRTDAQTSFEQILSGSGAWAAASNYSNMHFGYSSDALWMKINVQSVAQRETLWHLYFPYSSLSKVTLYRAGHPARTSGLGVPLSERDSPHRNAVFMFKMAPGEQATLYLRTESVGSLGVTSQIRSPASFASHSVSSTAMVTLYCGLLLGMGLYHLAAAWLFRDQNYFLFGSHLILFVLGIVAFSGLGGRYLWPEAGEWGTRLLPFGLTAANGCALLLLRNLFLDKIEASTWRVLFDVLVIISMILALASLFISAGWVSRSIPWLAIISTAFAAICLIRAVRLQLPAARLFLLGALLVAFAIALFAFRATGLMPAYLLADLAIQSCSVASMLVTSLALVWRTFCQEKHQIREGEARIGYLTSAHEQAQQQLQEVKRERDEANLKLKNAAFEDHLTGIPNRAALDQHINNALRHSRRRPTPLAVMLIDLDGFKQLHDQLGDTTTDTILCVMAERLTDVARETDFVARLGGDEFVLVADDVSDSEQARMIAERLLDTLATSVELEGQSVSVGVNIGVTLTHAADLDLPLLLRQADSARFSRKLSGRAGVSFHTADPTI